jgi:putative Mn2+ efflux pump MntP
MPVLGLLLGHRLGPLMGHAADYVAGALMIVLGIRAIREALDDDDEEEDEAARLLTAGSGLLLVGLSVSLDELAIGFSLGVRHVALGPALGYIAAQAFVVTFIGLSLGQRLGKKLGERAELASGILLALLGIALLTGH